MKKGKGKEKDEGRREEEEEKKKSVSGGTGSKGRGPGPGPIQVSPGRCGRCAEPVPPRGIGQRLRSSALSPRSVASGV